MNYSFVSDRKHQARALSVSAHPQTLFFFSRVHRIILLPVQFFPRNRNTVTAPNNNEHLLWRILLWFFFNLPFIYSLKGQFTQKFSFTHLLPATVSMETLSTPWKISTLVANESNVCSTCPAGVVSSKCPEDPAVKFVSKQQLYHHIFQPKYPLFTLAKVKSFPLWKRFCRLENASINVAVSKKWMKFQIWVTYPFTNPQGGRRQIQKSATRI